MKQDTSKQAQEIADFLDNATVEDDECFGPGWTSLFDCRDVGYPEGVPIDILLQALDEVCTEHEENRLLGTTKDYGRVKKISQKFTRKRIKKNT